MCHILIVDDSPTMRRMVQASLCDLPDTCFAEAGSGLEAIERLALDPVTAMILDLNMPDMHGIELLRFMRSHQAYQNIPVIVLTTRGDESSREAARAAGATVFLTKPFTPDALAARVREVLVAERKLGL